MVGPDDNHRAYLDIDDRPTPMHIPKRCYSLQRSERRMQRATEQKKGETVEVRLKSTRYPPYVNVRLETVFTIFLMTGSAVSFTIHFLLDLLKYFHPVYT